MAALEEIFGGDAGGNMAFTRNFSEILGIKRVYITLDHSKGAESVKIGKIASAEVLKAIAFDGSVSCGISDYDHPGQESVSSSFSDESPLKWITQSARAWSPISPISHSLVGSETDLYH